jgi:hypothetical protein
MPASLGEAGARSERAGETVNTKSELDVAFEAAVPAFESRGQPT